MYTVVKSYFSLKRTYCSIQYMYNIWMPYTYIRNNNVVIYKIKINKQITLQIFCYF